ncbi:helix-turn-helix domain-containing protein [Hirschia baltica]|nr:MarR family transcriptional regulator [Hirschia baltica]
MKKNKDASQEFLDLFYPIHYLMGMQIEDALRSGILTRQQACILWTIRAEGENGVRMRRKDIEAALCKWYDVTSSAISKSLRAMTRPPFDLLQMTEDPMNGREKFVSLTPKGKRCVTGMIHNGVAMVDAIVDHLTEEEIKSGIHFLSRVSDINRQLQNDITPSSTSKTIIEVD